MVTKQSLIMLMGLIGICRFAESNVVADRHRLARQTGDDSNVSTELRFVMLLDAYGKTLASEGESIKLYNYLVDNGANDTDTDIGVGNWFLRYHINSNYDLGEDFIDDESSRSWLLYYTLVSMLDMYIVSGPYPFNTENEEENPSNEELLEDFNELLANVTWCTECTPFDLPDTRDRVEISLAAKGAYFKNIYDAHDCPSPSLESAWKTVLALPPSSISEKDWYWERFYAMLARIFETRDDGACDIGNIIAL